MADLAITGLVILNSAGAPVTDASITINTETRTGTAASNFNGVDGVGAGNGTVFGFGSGAEVDVKYRCAGPSCGPAHAVANYGAGGYENKFFTHIPAAAGNYALGDMYIAGSALGFTGANGFTRADSSVAGGNNEGTANATIANSVTATTIFTANTTISAQFFLGYNAYIAAVVNAVAGATGDALGTISWALSLQEVIGNASTTIMNWTPDQINNGLTSSNASQNDTYTAIGTTSSPFVTLTAGRVYKLTINQASNSIARERVPEPGSMLLIALGLFALGAASRRRIK